MACRSSNCVKPPVWKAGASTDEPEPALRDVVFRGGFPLPPFVCKKCKGHYNGMLTRAASGLFTLDDRLNVVAHVASPENSRGKCVYLHFFDDAQAAALLLRDNRQLFSAAVAAVLSRAPAMRHSSHCDEVLEIYCDDGPDQPHDEYVRLAWKFYGEVVEEIKVLAALTTAAPEPIASGASETLIAVTPEPIASDAATTASEPGALPAKFPAEPISFDPPKLRHAASPELRCATAPCYRPPAARPAPLEPVAEPPPAPIATPSSAATDAAAEVARLLSENAQLRAQFAAAAASPWTRLVSAIRAYCRCE